MKQKINSSLIIALVLLLAAGGVVYFLDMPQYKKIQQNYQDIEILQNQLKRSQNQNQTIDAVAKNLEEANWSELKNKIEANFSSDPFYNSKMEVFFRDIIGRSGMTLSSLTFASAGSSETANKNLPAGGSSSSQAPASSASVGNSTSVKATSVNISVTGTYDQLKALLKIMERQAYLISVKSITFTGGAPISSFSITADIYSY